MCENGTILRLAMVAATVLAVGMGGCGKRSVASGPGRKPTTATATRSSPDLPKMAGQDDIITGAQEILIKDTAATRPRGPNPYVQDEQCASGNLVGAVKFKGALIDRSKVPPAEAVQLTGPTTIPNADNGEVEYYDNLHLRKPRYLHYDYYNVPTQTVLIVRGIKNGRRPEMNRAVLMVDKGVYSPHIAFGPRGERVMFGTYDSYPSDVILTSLTSGSEAMQDTVSAFNRDTMKPLGGGGVHYTERPKMVQSPPLKELDGFAVTSRRHLWKKAYVFVTDNPFCLVANGRFALDAVPVGTWNVDVWHPEFEPVQKSYQITIRKDETTELAVELKPPAWLAATQPAGKPPDKP